MLRRAKKEKKVSRKKIKEERRAQCMKIANLEAEFGGARVEFRSFLLLMYCGGVTLAVAVAVPEVVGGCSARQCKILGKCAVSSYATLVEPL